MRYRFFQRLALSFLTLLALIVFLIPSIPASAQEPATPVNAFFLNDVPADYAKREKLFSELKEGGANTLIIGPPSSGDLIDRETLPNTVYLAHQAGLKVFFVIPVRSLKAQLSDHPGWEDMRYDLRSGTILPAGRLDLFNPSVAEFLRSSVKDIASYFVDGILLGDDFYYGDTEGASFSARAAYKEKYGVALRPGKAVAKVGSGHGELFVQEGGEGFGKWTDLKRERLLEILQNILRAARVVNPDLQFGVPLHASGIATTEDILSRYAYDMTAFKELKIDYYWLAVPHRDLMAGQGMTYKKSIELLSRIVQATDIAVKDPARIIIVLQATYTSGKLLPYSEIEEVTGLVKKAGDPGVAFMIGNDTLPQILTKKLFRRP